MGGFGSGRHSQKTMAQQLVGRQDPLPAVTLKELQKHHVFSQEESVHFANYTSPGDLIRPDQMLAGQARRVEDKLVFGFLVGTYEMLVAELKERASTEGKPSTEGSLSKQGKTRFVTARVGLSWSACHFGGERPWLLCPGRSEPSRASEGPCGVAEEPCGPSEGCCGRRVSKLYLDGPWLVCRHCLGVGYESDHPWEGSRGLHRAQKIRQSLGGSRSLAYPFPPRPKHMQYCTYYMLRNRANFLLGRFATGSNTGDNTGDNTGNDTGNNREDIGDQTAEPESEELGAGGEEELRGGKKSKPTKSRPTLWERMEKVEEMLRSDAAAEEEVPSSLVAPP